MRATYIADLKSKRTSGDDKKPEGLAKETVLEIAKYIDGAFPNWSRRELLARVQGNGSSYRDTETLCMVNVREDEGVAYVDIIGAKESVRETESRLLTKIEDLTLD